MLLVSAFKDEEDLQRAWGEERECSNGHDGKNDLQRF